MAIGTGVLVREGKLDEALQNLRKKNARDGSSKKVREREQGYMKPGARRRKEKAENTKNSRKRNKNKDRY